MKEQIYCIGCGATIQTEAKDKIGYTPSSVLQKQQEQDADIYCQRCFRLRHYNEIQDVSLTDDDFLRLMQDLRNQNALIINVIDIFDFNGSLINGLQRFIGDNDLLILGNKRDLLPKSLKEGKLTQWMKERCHEIGLRPVDIKLVSAKKKNDIDSLLKIIEKYRKGRDVYIVGVTNVGKSTLINAIINQSIGEQNLITTSHFPGTTLDLIEIPLDDGHYIIDTPGIIHREQMAHYLQPEALKLTMPKKEIKPKSYQLNAGQTLFLGGLARFDYVQGDKGSFIVYLANTLNIHRTKLDGADAFYQKHQGELLQPIFESGEKPLTLERFEFHVEPKTDIVFSGLGWITAKQAGVVAGWVPKGVKVVKRKAFI